MEQEGKYVSEDYTGVKYSPIRLSPELPEGASEYFPVFKQVCNRLKQYGMTPGNSGNVSLSFADGFLVTSTGSNLGSLKEDEIVFVESCDLEQQKVSYRGHQLPSSESIMHWLIYRRISKIRAVLHAHEKFAIQSKNLKGVVTESEYEVPCGTLETAQMALDTFRQAQNNVIVLKNHGYVVIGQDLNGVCDLLLETHDCLLAKKKESIVY